MDHDQARASFERLASALDATADHLIGPGFEFARRSLTNAAGAATELARLHADEDTAEHAARERAEQDAAASRTVYGIRPHIYHPSMHTTAAEAESVGRAMALRHLSREYVLDLLGGPPVSTPDPFGPPSHLIVEHGDDCDHPGISTPIDEGQACPSCGAVARRQETATTYVPLDTTPAEYHRECRIHGDLYPCEGGCYGRSPITR